LIFINVGQGPGETFSSASGIVGTDALLAEDSFIIIHRCSIYSKKCNDVHPKHDLPFTDNPFTEKPFTGKPLTDKPSTENPHQLITKELNTNQLNTNLLITHPSIIDIE